MHQALSHWLDRLALRSANRSVRTIPGAIERAIQARTKLTQGDFLAEPVAPPPDLIHGPDRSFRFSSPVTTDWPANDIVHGKLMVRDGAWRSRPTIILVHGWNAELGYRYQFPWLARLLQRRGINAAMLELPFHSQRKPPGRLNFLSGDLVRMMLATRQAVADIRALGAWLRHEGSPAVGLWGFSLGAWLTGLILCNDSSFRPAVLATPVAKMERAIAELSFCRPIRETCEKAGIWPQHLNLARYRPRIARENVLLVEAVHDLFGPPETIEEIWECWDRPPIWRVPHGHISVLMSVGVMQQISNWIADRCAALEPVRNFETSVPTSDNERPKAP